MCNCHNLSATNMYTRFQTFIMWKEVPQSKVFHAKMWIVFVVSWHLCEDIFGVPKICATLSRSYMSKDHWAGVKSLLTNLMGFSVWEDFGHGPHSLCDVKNLMLNAKGLSCCCQPSGWMTTLQLVWHFVTFLLGDTLDVSFFPKNNHFLSLISMATTNRTFRLPTKRWTKMKKPLEGWRGKAP